MAIRIACVPVPSLFAASALLVALTVGCGSARAAGPPADAGQVSTALERLASTVGPSVVQIVTRGRAAPRRLYGRGVGSGVVVSDRGHVITNAHVVVGAERIDVVLAPSGSAAGKTDMRRRAKLLGIDTDSDIAVLSVNPAGLRPIPFADSDAVKPGQLVLALGSPLGLEGTVSMGVVSAVSRSIRPDTPVVFLQTDAPINPGSSGGPLVDARGQIIGINTFIMSTTGGSQGLGFAVPSNIVRRVFEQIRDEGGVIHGSIGVHAETVTADLATGLGLTSLRGVLISDVKPGGPAEAAGLERMDQIVSLDGATMDTARELLAEIYVRRPGSVVSADILRDGASSTVLITVGGLPGDPGNLADQRNIERHLVEPLGALAIDLTDDVRAQLPGLRSRSGVVVLDAEDALDDANALRPGDVIVAVNQTPVGGLEALRGLLRPTGPSPMLVLTVEREGTYRHLVVEPE